MRVSWVGNSTRRPFEFAAAQQVHVQVGHRLAAVAAVIGVRQWRKSRPAAAPPASQFQLPDELNALNVLGLLQRIRARARLETRHQIELDQAIAELEARYFARHGVPMPDLDQLARRWVTLAA